MNEDLRSNEAKIYTDNLASNEILQKKCSICGEPINNCNLDNIEFNYKYGNSKVKLYRKDNICWGCTFREVATKCPEAFKDVEIDFSQHEIPYVGERVLVKNNSEIVEQIRGKVFEVKDVIQRNNRIFVKFTLNDDTYQVPVELCMYVSNKTNPQVGDKIYILEDPDIIDVNIIGKVFTVERTFMGGNRVEFTFGDVVYNISRHLFVIVK